MRKSTAALGIAIASFGVAETQGNFSTQPHERSDGSFQSPVGYTLDQDSWLGVQLAPAEATVNDEPITDEQMQGIVTELNESGEPHCPDSGASEYKTIVIDNSRTNTQVCLGSAQIADVDDKKTIAFEAKLNPEATQLEGFELGTAFDETTDEKCEEALSSLSGFGEFLIEKTGLLQDDQELTPLIIGGRECTDFTPKPTRPNPPIN